MHSYTRIYILTYIHKTHIRTYIHTYIHMYIQPSRTISDTEGARSYRGHTNSRQKGYNIHGQSNYPIYVTKQQNTYKHNRGH